MRLFIAIPLSSAVETELAGIITLLKKHDDAVKWVDPKNIHLTLRFLGEVEATSLPLLKKAISDITVRHKRVKSTINTVGAFPNLKRPRVIWCGIASSVDELKAIADEIETELVSLGFAKEEKPFKAHLTIGRVKEGANPTQLAEYVSQYKITPIPVSFDRIVLFKSTLTQTGPIYEQLHTSELGKTVERFE